MSVAPSFGRGALLLALVLAAAGCARRPAMEPPAPEPPSAPTPPPAPPAAAPDTLAICVIEQGELREVAATYDPRTGDTLVAGRPFSAVFPAAGGYAANAPWYVDNLPFDYGGRCYIKYGLPRFVRFGEMRRLGWYHRGVPLFAERAEREAPGYRPGDLPPVIYVPVRPGCEFQTYQYEPTFMPRPCGSER